MKDYLYLIIYALVVWGSTIIKEICKQKRIDKLKHLDDSKIDAIARYEKKASFWDRFRK